MQIFLGCFCISRERDFQVGNWFCIFSVPDLLCHPSRSLEVMIKPSCHLSIVFYCDILINAHI